MRKFFLRCLEIIIEFMSLFRKRNRIKDGGSVPEDRYPLF